MGLGGRGAEGLAMFLGFRSMRGALGFLPQKILDTNEFHEPRNRRLQQQESNKAPIRAPSQT